MSCISTLVSVAMVVTASMARLLPAITRLLSLSTRKTCLTSQTLTPCSMCCEHREPAHGPFRDWGFKMPRAGLVPPLGGRCSVAARKVQPVGYERILAYRHSP